MGQVPQRLKKPRYLLIGSGRLARHLQKYFSLSGLDVTYWCRSKNPSFSTYSGRNPNPMTLQEVLGDRSHVLFAISDSGVSELLQEHPELYEKNLVHFSGTLQLPDVAPCHPLMSFGLDLYDYETYLQLTFITEEGQASFHQLFPELTNRSYHLHASQRPLYHAYCVMCGNFTQLLWWWVEEQFNKQLNLPKEILLPFKSQVFQNTLKGSRRAFTGPLARGERSTIDQHLDSLNEDERTLYLTFLKLYGKLNPDQLKDLSNKNLEGSCRQSREQIKDQLAPQIDNANGEDYEHRPV